MVHRENIKFIFSRLFLILNYSIPEKFNADGLVNFNEFIIKLKSKDPNDTQRASRLHRAVDDILIFPPVLHA
jgi:hypothetical protein